MENNFWEQCKTTIENQHSTSEYINGIHYVYACKCPMHKHNTIVKINENYSSPKKFTLRVKENDNIDQTFDIGHIDDHDRKKKWKLHSKNRNQRKRERKLLHKLAASVKNQSSE